jgi:hypothetical protein
MQSCLLCLMAGFPLLGLAACQGSGKTIERGYLDPAEPRPASSYQLPAADAPQFFEWMDNALSVASMDTRLNYSAAITAMAIVAPEAADNEDDPKLAAALSGLYPDFASALQAAHETETDVLPSIDMLDAFQKYTDDRVLAALELELSTGELVYPGGKQQWLQDLLVALAADADPARRNARAFLATAIRLGGGQVALEPQVEAIASGMHSRFMADKLRSTVTGFYGDSKDLEQVFLRDRLLQTVLGNASVSSTLFARPDPATELAMLGEIDAALSGSMQLRDAYNDFLAIQAIVTNPRSVGSLGELGAAPDERGWAVFPHSRSLEEQLFSAMPLQYGSPMAYLRDSLRDGTVELAPQADSGWYDYQQYSLETLLLPERAMEYPKLSMGDSYLKRLEDGFEATITQRRESQSKNLLPAAGSAAPGEQPELPTLEDRPQLKLEPAPTIYLRTARAYTRLALALRDALNPQQQTGNESYAWLLAEIDQAGRRYFALHCLSCDDIGLRIGMLPLELDALTDLAIDEIDDFELSLHGIARDPQFDNTQQRRIVALCREAEDWLAASQHSASVQGAFLAYDPRVSVPITVNESGIANWAVIGVRLLLLEHRFSTVPQLGSEVLDADGTLQARVDMLCGRNVRQLIPVYEYASFNSSAPLSRAEFRKWCDQSRSESEFQLVASAYGGSVGRSWLEQYGMWVILLICIALFRDRLFPKFIGKAPPAADAKPPATD